MKAQKVKMTFEMPKSVNEDRKFLRSIPGISDVPNISNFLDHDVQHVVSLANDSMVKQKLFDENILNSSEFKHSVYDKYAHGIEFRHKKTGFEGKEELDAEIRAKLTKILDEHVVKYPDNAEVVGSDKEGTEITRPVNNLDYIGQEMTEFAISEKYLNHFRKYRNRSFAEVCMGLAKKIGNACEEHGIKPTLLYSGGLDSEFMIRMFMDAGVDFQVVSFKYKDGSNDYEWSFVEKFVEQNPEVDVKLLELDIDELWHSEDMINLCKYTHKVSPMLLTQAFMVEYVINTMGGFAVSAGECRIDKGMVKLNSDNNVVFSLDDVTRTMGTYQWFKGQPSSAGCPPVTKTSHWVLLGGQCFQISSE